MRVSLPPMSTPCIKCGVPYLLGGRRRHQCRRPIIIRPGRLTS